MSFLIDGASKKVEDGTSAGGAPFAVIEAIGHGFGNGYGQGRGHGHG